MRLLLHTNGKIMPYFFSAASVAVSLTLICGNVYAEDDKPGDVDAVLKSKEFWEKHGTKGSREWTIQQRKRLDELKYSSADPVVRLRANKILVDLAELSRYRDGDDEIVAAAFRYLEARLKEAPVQKLCAEQGFTHYLVSQPRDGVKLFLIEHFQAGRFNCGLNLSWDVENEAIVGMQSWGAVAGP